MLPTNNRAYFFTLCEEACKANDRASRVPLNPLAAGMNEQQKAKRWEIREAQLCAAGAPQPLLCKPFGVNHPFPASSTLFLVRFPHPSTLRQKIPCNSCSLPQTQLAKPIGKAKPNGEVATPKLMPRFPMQTFSSSLSPTAQNKRVFVHDGYSPGNRMTEAAKKARVQ